MDEERPEGCCFDEWVGHWEKKARKKATVAGVTVPLLEALEEAGLGGRTVLDVGCGIGDLAIETVRRGAPRASGLDLSEEGVAKATRLAEERGVAGRATFSVGDGATARLPRSDVVVLNRVVCCYPDVESLMGNTLAAAGSIYAFTAPPSGGLAGRIARLTTGFANAWYRLRRSKFGGFRVFVHDVNTIDERVRAAGFRPLRRELRRLAWVLAVYERDGGGPALT